MSFHHGCQDLQPWPTWLDTCLSLMDTQSLHASLQYSSNNITMITPSLFMLNHILALHGVTVTTLKKTIVAEYTIRNTLVLPQWVDRCIAIFLLPLQKSSLQIVRNFRGMQRRIKALRHKWIAVFKTRFAPSPQRLLRVQANNFQDTTKPRMKW